MYKQCWVNCTFHTQLKHASHLVKARFSGKAGSCFLKVRAASLIRPRKVTQPKLTMGVALAASVGACAVEHAYPVPYAWWFGACAVEQFGMLVLHQMVVCGLPPNFLCNNIDAASYNHCNTNTISRAQLGIVSNHKLFCNATAISECSSNSLSHSRIYRQKFCSSTLLSSFGIRNVRKLHLKIAVFGC